MTDIDNTKQLTNIFAYQAPANQTIHPYVIPPNTEVIELLTGGRVFFKNKDQMEAFGTGTIFWHLPGDSTIFEKDSNYPYNCVTFTFSCKLPPIRQVPRCTIWQNREELEHFASKVIKSFYDNSYNRNMLGSYIYSRLRWEAHDYSQLQTNATMPDSLHNLIDCMGKNLDKDWSLANMAQMAKISIPSLHLLFKKHFNQSPHQYLLNRRIQEARNLLATTDIPAKEISYSCGFKNIETFYRAFKKQLTMSPIKYREKHFPPGYHTAARQ